MAIASRGNRYPRTAIRTAASAPGSLADCISRRGSRERQVRDPRRCKRAISTLRARDLDAVTHTADARRRRAADPVKPTCGNRVGFSASLNFLQFSFAE
jgi:hypothetical protein